MYAKIFNVLKEYDENQENKHKVNICVCKFQKLVYDFMLEMLIPDDFNGWTIPHIDCSRYASVPVNGTDDVKAFFSFSF